MIDANILGQLNTSEEQLIKHLDGDVREIFSTMVGAEISSSRAAATEKVFNDCITAMVGFAGNYNGMISISCARKLAISFASLMLGMEMDECDDDVRDALGEIANMLGGSFKHHFVQDGHEVRLSTPSVISGDSYVLSAGSVPDTLTLMFGTGEDHFMVSVYLEKGD